MGKRSLFDIYFLDYRLFSSNTKNLVDILNELSKKDNRILPNIRTFKNGAVKNDKFNNNNWKKLINKIEGSKIIPININELLGFKNDSERRKKEYQNKKYFVLDTILYNKQTSKNSLEDITNEKPIYKEITRKKSEDNGEDRYLKTYNKNFKWNTEKSKIAKDKRLKNIHEEPQEELHENKNVIID